MFTILSVRDCHLCTLHTPHQLASSFHIQMEAQQDTIVGDSLRAISSGLLQCLAQRLLALCFLHAEALTPFRSTEEGEKEEAEKTRLLSDAVAERGEWIGRVKTVLVFLLRLYTVTQELECDRGAHCAMSIGDNMRHQSDSNRGGNKA